MNSKLKYSHSQYGDCCAHCIEQEIRDAVDEENEEREQELEKLRSALAFVRMSLTNINAAMKERDTCQVEPALQVLAHEVNKALEET